MIAWSARRGWRKIDIVDCKGLMTEVNVDGLHFEMEIAVNNMVHIDRSEFDVMTDEDGEATTTTTSRPITAKKCISGKSRIRSLRTKFCLLDAGNFDVVFVEED